MSWHTYKSKFGIGDKVNILDCPSIVAVVQRITFSANGNTIEIMWMDNGCQREGTFYGWQLRKND